MPRSDAQLPGTAVLIDRIDSSPQDPNLRRVHVNGRVVAEIPVGEFDRLKISAGDPWNAQLDEAIRRARQHADARTAALKMLSARGYGFAELRDRLVRRRFDADLASAVVEELRGDGWIDDREHARALVQQALRRAPAGREWLVAKLSDKGIDDGVAGAVVDEALVGSSEVDRAIPLAQSRLRTMRDRTSPRTAGRIARALAARGFDEDTVRTVFERLRISGERPDGPAG